jgi:hypothetical protein
MGEQRQVVRVEHTDDEDRSVETHFSGVAWHSRALSSLLERVNSHPDGGSSDIRLPNWYSLTRPSLSARVPH